MVYKLEVWLDFIYEQKSWLEPRVFTLILLSDFGMRLNYRSSVRDSVLGALIERNWFDFLPYQTSRIISHQNKVRSCCLLMIWLCRWFCLDYEVVFMSGLQCDFYGWSHYVMLCETVLRTRRLGLGHGLTQ